MDSALEIVEDSFEMTSDAIFALMNRNVEAYVYVSICAPVITILYSKHAKLLLEGHELLRGMSDADKTSIMKLRAGSATDGSAYWNKWKKLRVRIMNEAMPAWAKVVSGSIFILCY